jgi:hypothetical protein
VIFLLEQISEARQARAAKGKEQTADEIINNPGRKIAKKRFAAVFPDLCLNCGSRLLQFSCSMRQRARGNHGNDVVCALVISSLAVYGFTFPRVP